MPRLRRALCLLAIRPASRLGRSPDNQDRCIPRNAIGAKASAALEFDVVREEMVTLTDRCTWSFIFFEVALIQELYEILDIYISPCF